MRTGLLLLTPMLFSIAGCSEKIEAQESSSELSEIVMPLETTDETANASEEKDTDIELRSPVGLD